MTHSKRRATTAEDPVVPDPAAMLDALSLGRLGPQPHRFNSLSEKTQESILRAINRGITPGTISSTLHETDDAIDGKTLRRYLDSSEGQARLKALKEADQS
jgi:hypothetical protein